MSSLVKTLRFDNAAMWLKRAEGWPMGVPFSCYMLNATTAQRKEFGRIGTHRDSLDEDVCVKGLVAGCGYSTANRRLAA
jgi:hypothetical protein